MSQGRMEFWFVVDVSLVALGVGLLCRNPVAGMTAFFSMMAIFWLALICVEASK